MNNNKIFFKGLNELRALAALFVILYHIELFKNEDHISSLIDSIYFSYFIKRLGINGVYLFFVLSGFLITYLLLVEKEKLKTILFKKFYLRRIYRIWPLYYLIVFIGFIVVPFLASNFRIFENTHYFYGLISSSENYSLKSLLLYLFFMPNVVLGYFNIIIVGSSQAWSVGVEEQFYILWPLLIFVFARKRTLYIFLFLLTFFITSNLLFNYFTLLNIIETIISYINRIITIIPFEFMTVGAIGGYMFLYHRDTITFLRSLKFSIFY